MNPMSPWRVVAAREIQVKLHDKTFLVSTAFLLVIVVASLLLPALISGGGTSVGVVDDRASAVVERAAATGADLEAKRVPNMSEIERELEQGDLDSALLATNDGYEVVGDSAVDAGVREALGQALTAEQVELNAESAGVSMVQLSAGSTLSERLLSPAPFPEGLTYALTFGFAFLFYITAISFGMVLAQSVVQEKETRIVEILAAAIPVRALLAGKVVGNTLLALGQLLLLASTALVGLLVTGEGKMLAELAAPAGWFAVFFLLGFVALAGLWAVAGSVATRQEDLQSTTLPAQTVLMVPLFAVLLGNDTMVAIASYIPIASTFAMPARMVSGDVPLWEPILAAMIVVAAAAGLVILAARIYERSLLQTQRRMGYRELLRN